MTSKRKFATTVLLLSIILFLALPNVNAVINPDFILPRNVYKYGGILTIAFTSDFDTLNPFLSFGSGWTMSRLVYENLLMTGPNSEICPWLAKTWEFSDGGLTLTFHLQENVTWSDGVPLTSEDVKFTFEGWKQHKMPTMKTYYENIESIETPDPYTVVFHYYKPDCTILSEAYLGPPTCIVPKHIWKDIADWKTWENSDPKLAIGSGPYTMKEWKKGEYLSFTYNPNYWQGRPYLDGINLVIIKLRDVQMMAFQKGEIAKMAINGNEVSRFLDPEKYQIFQTEDSAVPFFGANNVRRPGNDTDFRNSLEYLVDRQKLIDLAFYGYASRVHHVIPNMHEVGGWVPPEDITHGLNVSKAKEILENAGYKDINGDGWREYPNGDKMELKFTVSDTERYIRMAEVIIESLKNAGINVKIEVLDANAAAVKTYQTYNYDFTLGRWGWSYPEPLGMLKWFLSYGQNWSGYSNPEYDELFNKARATTDPDERRPIIWQMCRMLAEDHVYVPTVQNQVLTAFDRSTFGGWSRVNPYGGWANDKMWPWYNTHLQGEPETIPTSIAINVLGSAIEKEPVTISATLKDKSEAPIVGQYVDFYVGAIGVGASATDSKGVAKFTWVPMDTGNFNIKAVYTGSTKYKICSSEIKTVSIGSAPPPTPPPDYTMYYLAAIVVLIIAVIVVYRRVKKP